MPLLHNIWGLVLLWTCVGGLIIPEELPSILSVIYSYIPPIKKGTDSRVGVGFRFGEHADFQVLVELGPQTETAPIGPNAGDSKKRRQASKLATYVPAQPIQAADTVADTPGGKWLSSWKSSLINTRPATPEKPHLLGNQKAQGTIQNDYIVSHLSQLYKSAQTTTESTTVRTFPTTTTTTISVPQQENVVVNNTALDDASVNKKETITEK